jgi:hypothetical protein
MIPVAPARHEQMNITGPSILWYGMTSVLSRIGAHGSRNTVNPAMNYPKLMENNISFRYVATLVIVTEINFATLSST